MGERAMPAGKEQCDKNWLNKEGILPYILYIYIYMALNWLIDLIVHKALALASTFQLSPQLIARAFL